MRGIQAVSKGSTAGGLQCFAQTHASHASLGPICLQAGDQLDAWVDALAPVPDYPPALVSLPEKDLMHAVDTGRLPPRFKRMGPRALPVSNAEMMMRVRVCQAVETRGFVRPSQIICVLVATDRESFRPGGGGG